MANEPLFAEERHNKILQMLRKQKKLLVTDLCEVFGVSPATIRNDLNDLEKRGLLKRTHGGAIAGTKINFEPTSIEKDVANRERKIAIGRPPKWSRTATPSRWIPAPPPTISPRRWQTKTR